MSQEEKASTEKVENLKVTLKNISHNPEALYAAIEEYVIPVDRYVVTSDSATFNSTLESLYFPEHNLYIPNTKMLRNYTRSKYDTPKVVLARTYYHGFRGPKAELFDPYKSFVDGDVSTITWSPSRTFLSQGSNKNLKALEKVYTDHIHMCLWHYGEHVSACDDDITLVSRLFSLDMPMCIRIGNNEFKTTTVKTRGITVEVLRLVESHGDKISTYFSEIVRTVDLYPEDYSSFFDGSLYPVVTDSGTPCGSDVGLVTYQYVQVPFKALPELKLWWEDVYSNPSTLSESSSNIVNVTGGSSVPNSGSNKVVFYDHPLTTYDSSKAASQEKTRESYTSASPYYRGRGSTVYQGTSYYTPAEPKGDDLSWLGDKSAPNIATLKAKESGMIVGDHIFISSEEIEVEEGLDPKSGKKVWYARIKDPVYMSVVSEEYLPLRGKDVPLREEADDYSSPLTQQEFYRTLEDKVDTTSTTEKEETEENSATPKQ